MTREEATSEACSIFALAYRSIGNYDRPSDGFCSRCPAAKDRRWTYQNAGEALAYVRAAVVEKLARDGHKIAPGFTPDGREESCPSNTTTTG